MKSGSCRSAPSCPGAAQHAQTSLRNLRKLDCVAQRSDAPLRSAIKPSQIASIYLRCCALHRIRDT
jgi:hypothetical protein